MFNLIKIADNDLEKFKIFNEKTGEYVSVVPRFGANVNQIELSHYGELIPLLKGNHTPEEFDGKRIFNGAHLLPYPNRIKDGRYLFNNTTFQLEKNYPEENNAAHGFIFDKAFEIVDFIHSKNAATLILKHFYDGSIEGYPFKMEFILSYTLDEDEGFICSTGITNLSGRQAPVGAGWHPFLSLNKNIGELSLQVSVKNKVDIDSRMIPTGERNEFRLFDDLSQINHQEFDTCFEVCGNSEQLHETVLKDPENDLEVVLWQEIGDNKYNYLQLYIPPARDCIAVEPMSCNVNAFNNGDGLVVLEDKEIFYGEFGIKLSQ